MRLAIAGLRPVNWALLMLTVVLVASDVWAQGFMDSLFADEQVQEKPAIRGELDFLMYESLFLDILDDDPQEDFIDNDLRAMFGGTLYGDGWEAKLSVSLTHQFWLDDTRGNNSFVFLLDPQPWESYIKLTRPNWDFSAGYLLTPWGKGAFSMIDLPNPVDLRHGLSTPDEWIKLPVPQLKFDYYGEKWRAHVLYNPFFFESKIANTLSDWSVVRIEETQDLIDFPIFQQSVQQQIYPGIREYPAYDFLHGELGAWVDFVIPGWDVSLYGFTGYDRIVLPQFTEDFLGYVQNSNQTATEILSDLQAQEVLLFNPLYIQKPERNFIVAADVATTLAGYTWRAEFSFQPQFSLYDEDLNFLRPPMMTGLIGVDSLASSSFILSLNFFAQAVLLDPSIRLLQNSIVNAGAVVVARWLPEWTRLEIEARGGGLITDGSLFFQPSVRVPVKDNHMIIVGAEIIEGPSNRIGGTFAHNDTWFMRYRYQLGLD